MSYPYGTTPLCPKWHWDATAVSSHILPSVHDAAPLLAQDPRQSFRNCTRYTRSEFVPSHGVAPAMPGGSASLNMPYGAYVANVTRESDLLRLNEELTRCKERRFIPKDPKLYAPTLLSGTSDKFVKDLVPHELTKRAGCREADDALAWDRSSRLFFNPTRFDRMETPRKDQALRAISKPSA
jgi:hypothetical protein